MPALVAVGEHDKQEFRDAAELFARKLRAARPGHHRRCGAPGAARGSEAFRGLLLEFLA
jgi:hypothetical protein